MKEIAARVSPASMGSPRGRKLGAEAGHAARGAQRLQGLLAERLDPVGDQRRAERLALFGRQPQL